MEEKNHQRDGEKREKRYSDLKRLSMIRLMLQLCEKEMERRNEAGSRRKGAPTSVFFLELRERQLTESDFNLLLVQLS
jgi:hypothetical protein